MDEFEEEWGEKLSVYRHFPPFPLSHYASILEKGISAIRKLKLSRKYILSEFNQFVNAILYS